MEPEILSSKFSRSSLALNLVKYQNHNVLGWFSPDTPRTYGSTFRDIYTVMERAFYIKLREYEVLRRGFGSSILIGLLVGYM